MKKTVYYVLNDQPVGRCYAGLRDYNYGVGRINNAFGFLGCATKEIASHFGKYFGMLIIKAEYSDMINFEVISNS